jgi:hypothetical protein
MEQVISKIIPEPEKSKCLYGNEKMHKEQNNESEPIAQGNPADHIIKQAENTMKITKDNDGLQPTRQLFFPYATPLQKG